MSQRTFRNESRDDYLEAILLITGRKGYCRSTDIATELGISRPSVSVELGKLMDQGLLCFDDEKLLHLTESGKALRQNRACSAAREKPPESSASCAASRRSWEFLRVTPAST